MFEVCIRCYELNSNLASLDLYKKIWRINFNLTHYHVFLTVSFILRRVRHVTQIWHLHILFGVHWCSSWLLPFKNKFKNFNLRMTVRQNRSGKGRGVYNNSSTLAYNLHPSLPLKVYNGLFILPNLGLKTLPKL